MRRLVVPALLLMTAACADPRIEEVSAARATGTQPACTDTDVIGGCPRPQPQPGVVANAGASAAKMGASLTRGLMRLF